ncbi:MAG TPA: glycosyltransferase family 2 protein [Anaerolineales bacterium]|nr:glycosyltransferase family 2 protein [Anaerolineales bacterium]
MIALILFWFAAFLIVYTYIGFPLGVVLRGLLWGIPYKHEDLTNPPTVSIVISAYNEAKSIAAKLDNILSMEYPQHCLEVVIASDGSTDGTDAIVERYKEHGVKLLSLPRVGKAAALNAAVNASRGEILVFSDANSMYKADAIQELVRPFGDPKVGCVAGNQVYKTEVSGGSSIDGERAYWNFDRMLKQFQGKSGNTLAATGAIYAIRRSIFQPIPDGVSDDLFTSTGVIVQGYRLVFAAEAIAYEPIAATSQVEFGRKVRVIMRSWKALLFRRELLNPFRYKFYAIQLFSHKILRYLVVFPLLILFLVSPFLWKAGFIYQVATIGQIAFYCCALFGLLFHGTRFARKKIFTIPFYFCMVNAASLVAILHVLRGRQIKHWEPQRHGQTQYENIH